MPEADLPAVSQQEWPVGAAGLRLPLDWHLTGWRAVQEVYRWDQVRLEVEAQFTYGPTGMVVEVLVRQAPGEWLSAALVAMQALPPDAELRALNPRPYR